MRLISLHISLNFCKSSKNLNFLLLIVQSNLNQYFLLNSSKLQTFVLPFLSNLIANNKTLMNRLFSIFSLFVLGKSVSLKFSIFSFAFLKSSVSNSSYELSHKCDISSKFSISSRRLSYSSFKVCSISVSTLLKVR